ncbi:hypothetical protein ROHU_007344 [Labeo rohita]|uniref:Uncharacterized protein n=1 Tax=Labeo rohita TaxID=84645 RepID=A0A498MQF2_LABRO|nr:hypothetical protein ROHU_007344 [Labeo rohita]
MRIRMIYLSRSKSASLTSKSTPAAKPANRSSKSPNLSRLAPPLSCTRSGSLRTSGLRRAWATPQFSPHSLASRFGSAFHRGSPGLSAICNRTSSFRFQRLARDCLR